MPRPRKEQELDIARRAVDETIRLLAERGDLDLPLTREELPVPTATSLALEGFPLDQSAIVAGVLRHFSRWYEAWTARGDLRSEYLARCASIGTATV